MGFEEPARELTAAQAQAWAGVGVLNCLCLKKKTKYLAAGNGRKPRAERDSPFSTFPHVRQMRDIFDLQAEQPSAEVDAVPPTTEIFYGEIPAESKWERTGE